MNLKRKGIALKRDGDAPADIFFEEGQLAIVENNEAIAGHVRQRLMAHKGEWFLDGEVGLPWIRDLLGTSYDPVLAESIIKAEILDTDGVKEITSFSVRFDSKRRNMDAYDIEILTEYDEEVRL